MSNVQRSKALLTAAFALSVGLVATPALASSQNTNATSDYDQSSLMVSADGLDLSQKQDRQRLDREIRSAAKKVCAPKDGRLDLEFSRCYRTALGSARTQADQMAVPAIELAASGTTGEPSTTAAISAPGQP